MNKPEILVVDDEPQVRKLLRTNLSNFSYDVRVVTSRDEAIAAVARHRPDIILLDIHRNASSDGLNLCREVCESMTTPIIVLVVKNDRKTKLAALNAGADDCLTRPFDLEELEARIRAVLRRRIVALSSTLNGEISIRDLVIDLVKRHVTLKGAEIHLTPTEYKLLWILATHPGKVLNYATLNEVIAGKTENPPAEHILRVHINTLRKKLGEDRSDRTRPQYIYTEPCIGYRFADVKPSGTQIPEPISVVLT